MGGRFETFLLESTRQSMSFAKTVRIAATLVTIAVWVLCLLPLQQVSVPGGDKLHHMLAYATLMLMWILALDSTTFRRQALVGAALVLMGLFVECAQGLTTYRFFEWADVAANTAGVMLGWMTAFSALRILAMRRRKLHG